LVYYLAAATLHGNNAPSKQRIIKIDLLNIRGSLDLLFLSRFFFYYFFKYLQIIFGMAIDKAFDLRIVEFGLGIHLEMLDPG
jgi:hypothetical protein